MCPFPENYVPPKVINKLTLNEPAMIIKLKDDKNFTSSSVKWIH